MERSGERTRPRVLVLAPSPKHAVRGSMEQRKFAMARAPSPAREARALPSHSPITSLATPQPWRRRVTIHFPRIAGPLHKERHEN